MKNIISEIPLDRILNTFSEHSYEVIYSIHNGPYAGTGDSQYLTIQGTKGNTEEYYCDKNFNKNQDVSCVFGTVRDIGDYSCLSLRTTGSDGLDLVKVTSNRIW